MQTAMLSTWVNISAPPIKKISRVPATAKAPYPRVLLSAKVQLPATSPSVNPSALYQTEEKRGSPSTTGYPQQTAQNNTGLLQQSTPKQNCRASGFKRDQSSICA